MFTKKPHGWFKHLDFIIIDLLSLELSIVIGFLLRFASNPLSDDIFLRLSFALLITDFVVIVITEMYKNVLKRGLWKEFRRTVIHVITVFAGISTIMFVMRNGSDYSRLLIGYSLLIYLFLSYITCIMWKNHLAKKASKVEGRRLLVATYSLIADEVINTIEKNNEENYIIVGIVLENKDLVGTRVHDYPVVGDFDSACEYIRTNWVDEVIVNTDHTFKTPYKMIEDIDMMGTTVHQVLSDRHSSNMFVTKIGPYRCLTRSINSISFGQAVAKRLLDILGGLAGCILTGILYLIIAPKIKKESPGPVFYAATRIGMNGKPFKMYKFRSMYLDADDRKAELQAQNIVKDGLMFKMDWDPRIIGNYIDENGEKHTGIGEKIRSTSLDEFPQFYNVLKGEMSLVGTRPPTPDETEKYENYHKSRLAIKPGITGLWQVSGRSDITDFEEVVALDREYIDNYSFGLDLKILLQTVSAVVKKKGAK